MEEKTQKHYFTFGSGQRNEGMYVVIEATSADVARKRMVDRFGQNWSMQYTEDEWYTNEVSQEEQYGLTELK